MQSSMTLGDAANGIERRRFPLHPCLPDTPFRLFRPPSLSQASHLESFLSWAAEVLASRDQRTSIRDGFVLTGVMQALSALFKSGHRTRLVAFLPTIFSDVVGLSAAADSSQTLTRKLCMKLLQRIGLTYLPPRVAKWRYNRGQRSLLQNLTVSTR